MALQIVGHTTTLHVHVRVRHHGVVVAHMLLLIHRMLVVLVLELRLPGRLTSPHIRCS